MSNPDPSLVDQIDQCLPQTQCTQCTYPRCRDYAEAIADHEANINQCPPGGKVTIAALAELLQKPIIPLNEDFGIHEPKSIAFIEEDRCIGCKLCIKACPVDCIVGGPKLMHTVISAECTGCKLCIPACPTDCIVLKEHQFEISPGDEPSSWPGYSRNDVAQARSRTEARLQRIRRRELLKKQRRRISARKQMQKEILEAVQRTNRKRQNS